MEFFFVINYAYTFNINYMIVNDVYEIDSYLLSWINIER